MNRSRAGTIVEIAFVNPHGDEGRARPPWTALAECATVARPP